MRCVHGCCSTNLVPGIVLFAAMLAVSACSSAISPVTEPTWKCPSEQPSGILFTGAWPDSVAAADFNRDGKKDLVVANRDAATVSVLLGVGDGTFLQKVDYLTGASPDGSSAGTAVFVAVGDFNGDGVADLAVANAAAQSVGVFLGNGDGTFRQRADYRTTGRPTTLAVADFDGDGASDLAVTNAPLEASDQPSSVPVDVFFGDRQGTLKPSMIHVAPNLAASFVVAADFNGDGKADLAVTKPHSNSVVVILGDGTGGFGPEAEYPVIGSPSYLAAGDFNGDGLVDIAVTTPDTSAVSILLANRDGAFHSNVAYVANAAAIAPIPASLAVGDFNGDHELDLAVGLSSLRAVSVLLGRGDGGFAQSADYGSGVKPLSLAVGDFNGDGRDDLAVAGACATATCDTDANENIAVFLSCAP